MFPANSRRLRPTAQADPASFMQASRPGYDAQQWPGAWERPISAFPPDFPVGASSVVEIPIPDGCTGMRFINLSGSVMVSLNGGGGRTVLDGDHISGAQIRSATVSTGAGAAVTVQAWGFGEPF